MILLQNWWKTQQQGPSSKIINQESLDQFRSVETLGKDVISNIGFKLGEDKQQLESLDDVKQMFKVLDGHDSTVTEILSKYGANNDMEFKTVQEEIEVKGQLVHLRDECER